MIGMSPTSIRKCCAIGLAIVVLLLEPAARAVATAADGYIADALVLRETYAALHPGLLRYQTQAQLDASYAHLVNELARAGSRREAFLAFTEYTASVRCGHSYPSFYNQTDAIASELFAGRDRLPFGFRWIDGRMIVTEDFATGGTLRPGDEVLAIDGTPARSILARLLPYTRADGANDAKRIDQLQVRGAK